MPKFRLKAIDLGLRFKVVTLIPFVNADPSWNRGPCPSLPRHEPVVTVTCSAVD